MDRCGLPCILIICASTSLSHVYFHPTSLMSTSRCSLISPPHPSMLPTSQLSSVFDRPDLQPCSVLLQDRLVVIFPELLGGVLARHALQDLGSAWVFVDKGGDIVHVCVDDNVHSRLGIGMCGHIGGCECLRHDFRWLR